MSGIEEKFQHLSCQQLRAVLDNKSHVIVDIRDLVSFQTGHIPGAVHLTNESLADFLRDVDMDAPVVVCCYHGISSQQAAQFLVSQDLTEVYSLDGGYVDWLSQYPDCNES
jgi:thiosulfate sulfurtransferase